MTARDYQWTDRGTGVMMALAFFCGLVARGPCTTPDAAEIVVSAPTCEERCGTRVALMIGPHRLWQGVATNSQWPEECYCAVEGGWMRPDAITSKEAKP